MVYKVASLGGETTGLLGKLLDKYLSSETPVNLDGITRVDFTVNSDPASSTADRFKLVFYSTGLLPVTFTSIKAYEQNSNVMVEWKVSDQLNIAKYEVE